MTMEILVRKVADFTYYFECYKNDKGTFINDVPRFLAIFDLPTNLVQLYDVPFGGLSLTPYLPYMGRH